MKMAKALLAVIGFLAILEVSLGDPAERAARTKRGAGCGETLELEPNKPIELKSQKGTCGWVFLGTKSCVPEIVCPSVELKAGDCSDEFLTISDGIGGEEKLCGNAGFTSPKKASAKGRDIYVDSQVGGSKGFSCKAQCSKNPGVAVALALRGEPRKEEHKCVCGFQHNDDRIVGGEDAKMNEFPWQVAVVKPGTREPTCGGSVINNRYILTAAHCFWFAKSQPGDIEVLIHAHVLDFTITREDASVNTKLGHDGSMQARGYNFTKRTDADEGTQRFKVVEIINHPLFTVGYDYDAALLKLDRKINLAAPDAPIPICLPKPGNWKETFNNKITTVTGWGLGDESAGATTRLQQKLDVPIIPIEKCAAMMPHELTDRMLCAGFQEGKKDACTGDSGGPLFLPQANKQYMQIGIVSWGEGCAQVNRPGMYSRVTEFLPWILHHTNTPGTVWCRDSKG